MDTPSNGYYVDVNYNLSTAWDDKIDNLAINGTSIFSSTGYPGMTSLSGSLSNVVHAGLNWITVDIYNRSIGGNNTSPMHFNLSGTLSTSSGTPLFVRNNYFIPNSQYASQTWGCAPQNYYLDTPKVRGFCVKPNASYDTLVITNYNYLFDYQVDLGTFLQDSMIVIATPIDSVHLTVTDSNGCFIRKTIRIYTNPPNITVTSPVCINHFMDTVHLNIIGGHPPMHVIDLTNNYTYADTNLILFADTFKLVVLDSLGCSDTENVRVAYIADTVISGSHDICFGDSTLLTFGPPYYSPTGYLSYDWEPGTDTLFQNWVHPSSTSVYTCTATSNSGCSVSDTFLVKVHSLPIVSIDTGALPCPFTFHFSSDINPVVWSILSPGNTIPLVLTGNTYSPPLQFSPLVNVTYTVIATDSWGCTGTKTVTYTQNGFCCNYGVAQQSQYKFSNYPLYSNGNAGAIMATFNNSVITTNQNIIFDGIIIIDQNIEFVNCPNIMFTPGSSFQIQNGAHLKMSNCELRAFCDMMWYGIDALNVNTGIELNECLIRDMYHGVCSNNGAQLLLNRNRFIDNFIGVYINNSTTDFNTNTNKCVILDNEFTSSNNWLLYPANYIDHSRFGIFAYGARSFQVGKLNQGLNPNTFRNIITGIYITTPNSTLTEQYRIYDNVFENIHYNFTNTYDPGYVYNTWYYKSEGAGIYSEPVKSFLPTTSVHRLFVEGDGDMGNSFVDCDKAVVGRYTSGYLKQNRVEDCFDGFMFDNATNQLFYIGLNHFNKPFMGIYAHGDVNDKTIVEQNFVAMAFNPLPFAPLVFPIGIKFDGISNNSTTAGYTIKWNTVRINNDRAGVGIYGFNATKKSIIRNNTVNIETNAPMPFPSGGGSGYPEAAAIYCKNCKGTQYIKNRMQGTNGFILLTNPNSFSGLKLAQSRECLIECNKFYNTRWGTVAEGDCNTVQDDRVRTNSFNNHVRAMQFEMGSGTFGNIGNATQENNNTFNNSNLGAGGFGIYRNTTVPAIGSINTSIVPFTYSGANSASAIYLITPNPTAASLICPTLNNAIIANYNDFDFGIDEAENIANDEMNITEYPEVLRQIMEQELLYELEENPEVRNDNPDLQIYYQQNLNTDHFTLIAVDRLLAEITDTLVGENHTLFNNKLKEATDLNSSIQSNDALILNEKLANKAIINWYKDSLYVDSTLLDSVRTLANLCPYVGGRGVYKARTVLSIIEPNALFNDKNICNSAGVNKNQHDDEMADPERIANLTMDMLKVTPNPAQDFVTVEYQLEENQMADLQVYDINGRMRLNYHLEFGDSKLVLPVHSLEPGLYMFKLVKSNLEQKMQKILIQR